jgi:protein-S-isoprenylcysteine O-methyltransferase Ste14
MKAAMKGTNWEFRNRALLFGLIFAVAFPLYSLDPQNSTVALANWLRLKLGVDADLIAHLVFIFAALVLFASALIRTWASSYLRAEVVYAADVKTESLVADGPYRHVRNPLYLANVLLIIGVGAAMSRTGFFVAVVAMLLICYRLILREEAELQESQGDRYERYRKAVPRLWPSLRPRISSAGSHARWSEGLNAESWYWAFVVAGVAFDLALSFKVFLATLVASLLLLWISRVVQKKRASSQSPG